MPFVFQNNVRKALISVEDLTQLRERESLLVQTLSNCRTKVRVKKIDSCGGTTHNRGILSRFSDKRPNRSHLRGTSGVAEAGGPPLAALSWGRHYGLCGRL